MIDWWIDWLNSVKAILAIFQPYNGSMNILNKQQESESDNQAGHSYRCMLLLLLSSFWSLLLNILYILIFA